MLIQSCRRVLALAVVGASLSVLAGCLSEGPGGPAHSSQHSLADGPELIAQLLDFDLTPPPGSIQEEGAFATQVAAAAPHNGKALAIRFSPEGEHSAIHFRPAAAWDWSNLEEFHIALDASNPGPEPMQLFLTLTDSHGTSLNRAVNIAAGEQGTYYAVIAGQFVDKEVEAISSKTSTAPPWASDEEMFVFRFGSRDIDLSAITELSLWVRGTLEEKQLLVDNIRLRRNLAYDPSYLQKFVDQFGQNAKADYPLKVHSQQELQDAANAELAALAASGALPDRSRFGGWKDGPRRQASGYFRTEKVNDKWWLVDPDGYLFFSNGLANVRMANMTTLTGVEYRDPSVRYVDPGEVTPEDSIGIVTVSDEVLQTAYVAAPLRRDMFTWLPDYDDELADHYSYRRSVHKGPLPSGETFSFYRANLERRYGQSSEESYIRKWEEVTLERMLDWGFTSMGNWVDPAFYPNQQVPYFANGWIIGDFKTLSSGHDEWSPMPDSFDPEFVRRARITVGVIAEEIQGSPWCVGVFVDNEKSWGHPSGSVSERFGLILDALSKNASESPAKQAFTKRLRDKYGAIANLNKQWRTDVQSWEAFAAGVTLNEFPQPALDDFSTLLAMLSEQYFRVVHDALEEVLPNHLYMGVRMAGWGMPQETIRAAVKYSDVLSFNSYKEGLQPNAWSFLDEIDMPSLIGEFHIGATDDSGLFHPGLVSAENQQERATMYLNYMNSVLAQDTMVGAHWFQYIDSPITGRTYDGENYNVGFVSVTDIPYPEMVEAARTFNTALYRKRYGKKP
ncbi:agarase [Pseudomaricurvus alcaniphilus]|nr:agarase [Pseudomaricurvus alcaniphilus]